jgi:2-oxo-hept-3-ene-1,7-dioate hydratase
MPIPREAIDDLARRLHVAEQTRERIPQISRAFPDMTMADGYAIQAAWLEIKRAEGRRTIGYKIGLTSRAMQQNAQSTEPDYGALLDDMLFAEGSEIPSERFITPLVEVELAFILGRRLSGPGVSLFDVLAATDYVVPALEIIDLRVQPVDPETKAMAKALDSIADNAACGGVVMGGRPVRPDAVDLRWTCAGRGAFCTATASSRKPDLRPECSITPRRGSPGSPTSSLPTRSACSRGRSCSADPSRARSWRGVAMCSTPTTAFSAGSGSVSPEPGKNEFTHFSLDASAKPAILVMT